MEHNFNTEKYGNTGEKIIPEEEIVMAIKTEPEVLIELDEAAKNAETTDLLEDTDASDCFRGFDGDDSESGIPEKTQEGYKIRKKYKQIRPKVNTEWSHDDIIRLINAVEERPTLWDINSPQYKLPKTPAWQAVADILGERSADECKAKWSNLRVTFKTNLSKRQKSGSESIVWKYYNIMKFLDLNETSQTSETSSTMTMPGDDSNSSVTEGEPNLPKRPRKILSVPPMPLSQPSPSNSDVFQEIAAKAICTIAEKSYAKDQFDAFGTYVASELRSLPVKKGIIAKRILARALMNVIDEVENSDCNE